MLKPIKVFLRHCLSANALTWTLLGLTFCIGLSKGASIGTTLKDNVEAYRTDEEAQQRVLELVEIEKKRQALEDKGLIAETNLLSGSKTPDTSQIFLTDNEVKYDSDPSMLAPSVSTPQTDQATEDRMYGTTDRALPNSETSDQEDVKQQPESILDRSSSPSPRILPSFVNFIRTNGGSNDRNASPSEDLTTTDGMQSTTEGSKFEHNEEGIMTENSVQSNPQEIDYESTDPTDLKRNEARTTTRDSEESQQNVEMVSQIYPRESEEEPKQKFREVSVAPANVFNSESQSLLQKEAPRYALYGEPSEKPNANQWSTGYQQSRVKEEVQTSTVSNLTPGDIAANLTPKEGATSEPQRIIGDKPQKKKFNVNEEEQLVIPTTTTKELPFETTFSPQQGRIEKIDDVKETDKLSEIQPEEPKISVFAPILLEEDRSKSQLSPENKSDIADEEDQSPELVTIPRTMKVPSNEEITSDSEKMTSINEQGQKEELKELQQPVIQNEIPSDIDEEKGNENLNTFESARIAPIEDKEQIRGYPNEGGEPQSEIQVLSKDIASPQSITMAQSGVKENEISDFINKLDSQMNYKSKSINVVAKNNQEMEPEVEEIEVVNKNNEALAKIQIYATKSNQQENPDGSVRYPPGLREEAQPVDAISEINGDIPDSQREIGNQNGYMAGKELIYVADARNMSENLSPDSIIDRSITKSSENIINNLQEPNLETNPQEKSYKNEDISYDGSSELQIEKDDKNSENKELNNINIEKFSKNHQNFEILNKQTQTTQGPSTINEQLGESMLNTINKQDEDENTIDTEDNSQFINKQDNLIRQKEAYNPQKETETLEKENEEKVDETGKIPIYSIVPIEAKENGTVNLLLYARDEQLIPDKTEKLNERKVDFNVTEENIKGELKIESNEDGLREKNDGEVLSNLENIEDITSKTANPDDNPEESPLTDLMRSTAQEKQDMIIETPKRSKGQMILFSSSPEVSESLVTPANKGRSDILSTNEETTDNDDEVVTDKSEKAVVFELHGPKAVQENEETNQPESGDEISNLGPILGMLSEGTASTPSIETKFVEETQKKLIQSSDLSQISEKKTSDDNEYLISPPIKTEPSSNLEITNADDLKIKSIKESDEQESKPKTGIKVPKDNDKGRSESDEPKNDVSQRLKSRDEYVDQNSGDDKITKTAQDEPIKLDKTEQPRIDQNIDSNDFESDKISRIETDKESVDTGDNETKKQSSEESSATPRNNEGFP